MLLGEFPLPERTPGGGGGEYYTRRLQSKVVKGQGNLTFRSVKRFLRAN